MRCRFFAPLVLFRNAARRTSQADSNIMKPYQARRCRNEDERGFHRLTPFVSILPKGDKKINRMENIICFYSLLPFIV